jgi:hypothetical protein
MSRTVIVGPREKGDTAKELRSGDIIFSTRKRLAYIFACFRNVTSNVSSFRSFFLIPVLSFLVFPRWIVYFTPHDRIIEEFSPLEYKANQHLGGTVASVFRI